MDEAALDYQTAAQNVLLYHDLTRVLAALDKADVPVIVLKGAALAATVYPTIAHRPMGDVDILVHPTDLTKATMILERNGFLFTPEPSEKRKPFDTAFTGENSFYNENGLLIELHWQITPVEWLRGLVDLDAEALWRNARPFVLSGIRAWQLSPVDTLLHLCLHLAAHNFAHSVGYRDVAYLLARQDPFPWQAFMERVRKFRIRAISYFVLETVATSLGSPVPTYVLDDLRPHRWQRWLVRHIADPHRALSGELAYSHSRSYALHLVVADRVHDVLKVLFRLFFPGSTWLAQRYHLSKRVQVILAWFWHPLFVLWQGIRALWQVLAPAILEHSSSALVK